MIISENLRELSKIFHKNCPLYIVGGYVRDFLLNKSTKDVDITSSLSSKEVIRLLKNTKYTAFIVNEKLGTVLITIDDEKYEYTPFRKDNYSHDGFHSPLSIDFGVTIKDDYLRRDFTIDALYYDIEKDEIIDFGSCKKDIENHIIRSVRDPETVFMEDALRILRMLRFYSVLGFEIEENTLFAGKKCVNLVKSLSNERIVEEYKKTIEKVSFFEMFDYIDKLYEIGLIETLYNNEPKKISYFVSDGLIVYAPNLVFFYEAIFERFYSYKLDFINDLKINSFSDIEEIEPRIFDEVEKIFGNDRLPNKTKREIKDFISFCMLINKVKKQRELDIIITHYYNIINSILDKRQSRIMVRNNIILNVVSRFHTLKEQGPLTIKELVLSGDEVQKLGVKKENTSIVLKLLLEKVVLQEVENDKECLKKFIMEEKLC